jgi:hypothetical protein
LLASSQVLWYETVVTTSNVSTSQRRDDSKLVGIYHTLADTHGDNWRIHNLVCLSVLYNHLLAWNG